MNAITEQPAHGARHPRPLYALVALAALFIAGILALQDISVPDPLPIDAPEDQFSAARAHAHIREFATAPHPMGSAEHRRVRAYLVEELRRLGLEPEVHDAVGMWPGEPGGPRGVGRVQNVIALIEGTDPTGRVILAAHYDSVPSGPGANDDGAGVASILETARALTETGFRPRNDIVLLLTDGEEKGLFGAEAFMNSHPLAEGPAVVLNHEARGAGGSASMFRATPGNSKLMSVFGRAAVHPVADSASADVAAQLPNDTDFTPFRLGGLAVLDFAYLGKGAYYHSVLDNPGNVSLGSLQQMGDNTLALAAAFGMEDLGTLEADSESVYFNVPPGLLIRYPAALALPLALLALVIVAGLIVLARRRGLVSIPKVLLGVVVTLLLVGLGVGLAMLYWRLLTGIRPGYQALPTGTPYRPALFQAALLLLLVALTIAVYLGLRRRAGPGNLALGGLLVLVVAGLGAAAALPGTSHAMVLPALGAAVGGIVAVLKPGALGRTIALAAGLVPAALLLAPGAWALFEVGLSAAPFGPVPIAVLSVVLAFPLIEALIPPRRSAVVPAAALMGGVAATVLALLFNPLDHTQPVPTMLTYALDAGTGTAAWATPGSPDGWNSRYVSDELSTHPVPQAWGDRAYVGEAEAAPLPGPELTVTEDSITEAAGGESFRTLKLTLATRRGASAIGLYVDGSGPEVLALSAGGRRIKPDPYNDGGDVGFRFEAVAESGEIEAEIRVGFSPDPVRVHVVDYTSLPESLDRLPGYAAPPPDKYLLFGETAVARGFEIAN